MPGEVAVTGKRAWLWPTVATIVGVLAVAYFYRKFWTSGFTVYQGDVGDARLTALIAAHWANPMQFHGGLTDLGFYYPVGGGLGFSDSMLAFGLVTAPLMWLGMGALPAFQWTLIAFTVIGYVSTIAFLRLGPRSPWPVAIIGGVLVNVSNGLLVASAHPQLVAFSLCPLILLGGLSTTRARSRPAQAAWGLATGLLLGLVSYSAFYVGWFLILGLSLTAAIAALLVVFRSDLRPSWRRLALGVGSGVIGFALLVPLFLITYLPVSGQPRTIENVLYYALHIRELTNVSTGNLLWGQVLVEPQGDLLRAGEWSMAPTPLLVLLTSTVAVVAVFLWRRLDGWSILGLATVAAGVIVWVLPVDFHGLAPWRIVFELPGAAAIRAIGRIEILAGMMFALGLVILLTQWWRSSRSSPPTRVIVAVLLLLVAFEQTNWWSGQRIPSQKVVAVDSIARPPANCESFVLLPPFDEDRHAHESRLDQPVTLYRGTDSYLIDAMFIARSTGVPTWNGYSGGTPDGWNLWPDRTDYMEQVKLWQAANRISNACGLRLSDSTWLSPEALASAVAASAGR